VRVGRGCVRACRERSRGAPVPVLEPGRGRTKTGRLWTYVRDDRPAANTEAPAVLFRYAPDRKGERPREHLKPFSGILQANAYAGFGHSTAKAFRRRRAGHTPDAPFTNCTRRTTRRSQPRHWNGSAHSTRSKATFAAAYRRNAPPSARPVPGRSWNRYTTGCGTRSRVYRRSPSSPKLSATCSRAGQLYMAAARSLQRRPGETLQQLLERLDAAIDTAITTEQMIDEINPPSNKARKASRRY
jgi:hypothetical protein